MLAVHVMQRMGVVLGHKHHVCLDIIWVMVCVMCVPHVKQVNTNPHHVPLRKTLHACHVTQDTTVTMSILQHVRCVIFVFLVDT